MGSTVSQTYRELVRSHGRLLDFRERQAVRKLLAQHHAEEHLSPFPLPEDAVHARLQIVQIITDEIGLGKPAVLSVLLYDLVEQGKITSEEINRRFNTSVEPIINGLSQVGKLYRHNASIETENFRKLLLSFAEDVRVILIMVAERLYVMRHLERLAHEQQQDIARECAFLYAPLAHRMGLYAIKSEMEDLSLKYTNRDIYKDIAHKLNETKRSRDRYIAAFITPLKERLAAIGARFQIKGRTKSIHSIYSKMRKQGASFEEIYDLFAIRIIFDVPPEREKAVCWQAYSIVTDMYQPNPNRLRDWISIPKSNGYESLHTTVVGPQGKWVEVQIRTTRMDEVAEKGLAAHWKYKGIKAEKGMDEWLKNVREILLNPELNAIDFMDEFKLHLYDEEVFIFTPGGDLHKLPRGATVLDFAFQIHTELGCKCVGGKVNGRNVPIKQTLTNGDQVEILTSPSQKPNRSWLDIVCTSRAKNKIRQSLKEAEYKNAEIGRETLARRFKNWKLDIDEGHFSRMAKKLGYKAANDMYQDVANGKLDMHSVRETYLSLVERQEAAGAAETKSAEAFIVKEPDTEAAKEDILVIESGLKHVDYKPAKCCNPIYGDEVFGFVSTGGGIKVHRTDCPNAPQLIARFGYRIVKTRWSGKVAGKLYPITLRVIGHDDLGIVTNITSLISKSQNMQLRSMSIDSGDGLFRGNITLMVNDLKNLEAICKKIKQVKGVKQVTRT